jgi:hypothetical protein
MHVRENYIIEQRDHFLCFGHRICKRGRIHIIAPASTYRNVYMHECMEISHARTNMHLHMHADASECMHVHESACMHATPCTHSND